MGIRTRVSASAVSIPAVKAKTPDFTVWEARRNQKRRLYRYLSLPVFACACGHHSLAHGGMGCEGVTDNGDGCTCKRGAR